MTAIAVTGISVGLAAGTSQAAVTHPQAARPAATSYSAAGGVLGVAAAANNNAWAVGYAGGISSSKLLMLHWNGSAWSRVTKPAVLASTGSLSAITVVNSKDAWAVGSTGSPEGTIHSLILHWNGSAWSQVTSPAPVKDAALSAVTATSKGAFAVGYYYTGESALDYWSLTFRLTGSKWSRVAAKTNDVSLDGVATSTAGTTWATANEVGMITGGLAKWNGNAWSWTSFPVEGQYHALNGIAAGPGNTAFAVGTNGNAPATPPLGMKWTGHAWQKVTVSAPKSSGLDAVTVAPGGTAWAVGSTSGAGGRTLIVRWNGHEFVRVASPNPESQIQLAGIHFSAANYGWAVGYNYQPSGAAKTVILHWNGHSWS